MEGSCYFRFKAYVADYFEITAMEQQAVYDLLRVRRKELLEADRVIWGFHVGVDSMKVEGQKVLHCCVQLVPRRVE